MTQRTRVYLHQLRELTLSEWKLREQSSLTGFLWTLLNPVITYLVLYWLFTQWMHSAVQGYAAFLIIGVVQYGFFNSATTYAMTSLLRRRGIMMNFTVPRELLVLSSVFSSTISFLLEVALMLVFITAMGTRPNWLWAFLPALLFVNIALVLGVSLAISVLAVRFPDFDRVWNIAVTVGFFLTPVFYTLDSISPERRRMIRFNPLAHLIEQTRSCLVRSQAPSAPHFGALVLLCVVACAAGYAVFKSQEKKVSDYVVC